MSKPALTITVNCRECTQPFERKTYEKRQCCSPVCANKLRSASAHAQMGYLQFAVTNCKACHKEFTANAKHARKYCSLACKHIGEQSRKRHEEMHSLYLSGLSSCKIAQHYGITRQRVYQIFKLNGWSMRERGKRP